MVVVGGGDRSSSELFAVEACGAQICLKGVNWATSAGSSREVLIDGAVKVQTEDSGRFDAFQVHSAWSSAVVCIGFGLHSGLGLLRDRLVLRLAAYAGG